MDSASGFTLSELAKRSGVSASTIKLYLREGLLPRGDLTRPRRAYYDALHLRRLALIRALHDVGGLSLAATRRALPKGKRTNAGVLGFVAKALHARSGAKLSRGKDQARARAEVDALLRTLGMNVRRSAPARNAIADALVAMRALTIEPLPAESLLRYFETVRLSAEEEVLRSVSAEECEGKEGAWELAVLETMLSEPLLVAARRLWIEHFVSAAIRRASMRRKR